MNDFMLCLFQKAEEEQGPEDMGAYQSILAALNACGTEIEQALGADFLSRLEELDFKRYHLEAYASFQSGFRAAVELLCT